MANTWYETVLLGRPAGATPLTWDEFTKLFMNHFLPDSLMQKYARDFERLVQTPDMDVSTYNTKFFAPHMKTLSYSDAVNLARKIEIKGREKRATSDLRKKAKTLGSFSGDRVLGDHHHLDIVILGRYMPLLQSVRPVVDHIWLGHHLRDCPYPPRNFSQASIQSAAPTQTTRNTSGATGIGNGGRGTGDRATVNQGQGNAGRGQARVFAFTRHDAQASNVVVTGILSVCSFDAFALIDPRSTHSYVSSYFALRFNRQPELLNDPFLVAAPVGESLLAEYMYRACQIQVEGRDTLADLIVLDMIDFDMLMGMDWLFSCYAIVDCQAKIVKFEIPNKPNFVLKGGQVPEICKVVFFMKAQ
ncbi:uncharacterized protein [Nicotiana tomentosiformis]|uniref:uncharacterized protein n=1 Tax=Nicotiana tomentosiformis TaxID=4098 RepID=UPI00388C78F0